MRPFTFRWAVYRHNLLLTRTLTQAKARKIAAQFPGATVAPEFFQQQAVR